MKYFFLYAVLTFFIMLGSSTVFAQSGNTIKHKRMKKTSMVQSDTSMNVSSSAMSGEMNASGDPNYLNHPYFNGESRWTSADSLYTHGDFPWALMQQHPDNFHFDAASGQWQMLNTETLGTMKPTR